MTKRKYKRRGRSRRRRGRKRRYRRKSTLVVGMPLKHTCKLRYTEVITLDASAGTNASSCFRMNNIYDPWATGTGHQPRHYDLLAEVYNYYTVRGAKITAKIVGYEEGNPNRAQVLGIRVGNQTVLTVPNNDLPALHEAGRTLNTKWCMVNAQDPTRTRTLKHYWSLKKTKANTTGTTDDVLTGTTAGAGPSRQDYAVVFCGQQLLDPLTNPCRLQILVTVDYVVQFRGVKSNLPQD